MSDCFAFMGETERSELTKIEPIWGPVERYSLAEKASSAAAAKTTLPDAAIQRDIWQYPPAEIPELRTMRGADMIFQQPGQPPQPANNNPETAPPGAPAPTPEEPGGALGLAAS
jgi:hypothetical protein